MSKYKSIKEMKQMFHNPAYSKIVVYGYKHISVYLTRLLLMLPFSANFWTFLILVFTIVAAVYFSMGGYMNQVWGIIALHLAFLIDVCDGEVAQYRQAFSTRGKFLDYISHGIFPIIYASFGYGMYVSTGNFTFLLLGISGLFFHGACAHNRWAYLATAQKGDFDVDEIRKKDGFLKKICRFATMGNFEFETGAVMLILILLKLDWLFLWIFGLWLPVKWAVQAMVFVHDLKPKQDEKRIKQSFNYE